MKIETLVLDILALVVGTTICWLILGSAPVITPEKSDPKLPDIHINVPPRKPLFPREDVIGEPVGTITVGGSISPEGKEVQCDLPADILKKNIASRGLGCCVFRTISYIGLWQHILSLYDFPEWMVKSGIEGGGYPEKVDQLIPRIAKDRNLPVPEYIQVQDKDISVLKQAMALHRMIGVTYNGHDPHYSGTIAHMVALVYLDDRYACIRDNNFVGENELVWMTTPEFVQRWTGGSQGWAIIFTGKDAPPPPLPPKN